MFTEPLGSAPLDTLRAEVSQRMTSGYDLPPLPDSDDVNASDFSVFAKECSRVLKVRASDLSSCSEGNRRYLYASDAVIVFNIAVVGKDVDLIRVYHRLIQKVESPRDLQRCAKLLRRTLPDSPVSTIFTEQHVSAAETIKQAVWDWEDGGNYDPDSPHMQDLMDKLTMLSFEDLTKTDRLAVLIKRGVFNEAKLRTMLAEFADIEAPLLEGTL